MQYAIGMRLKDGACVIISLAIKMIKIKAPIYTPGAKDKIQTLVQGKIFFDTNGMNAKPNVILKDQTM